MNRISVVARYEFTTHARRWEFLVVTLGLPIVAALLVILASVPNFLYLRQRQMEVRGVQVGLVNAPAALAFPSELKGAAPSREGAPQEPRDVASAGGLTLPQTFRFQRYATVAEGEKALLDHTVEYLYVFPNDYVTTGQAECVTLRRSPFDVSVRPPMAMLIREGLLAGRIDDKTLARVRVPLLEKAVVLDDRGRRVSDPFTDQVISVVLPYAMMALLVMSLLGSSTYILRGLTEEKESRIQEVLLSSVRPADLFYGKIIGLGALGLVQVSVWLAFGLPLAARTLSAFSIGADALAIFVLYFLLGFALYASILAGIGSIGSTEKEANHIFAIFVMLFSSPLLFLPILLDAPNGALARAFSLSPFTSPLMMVMRSVSTRVPTGELALSIALLAAAVVAALRVSLKVFQAGLLMYGKSIRPAEVWRALRS